MSETLQSLARLSKALPTLELKVKVEDGKTFLMAGNEAVFRCRTNELGEAYGLLVMQALEILPQALMAIEYAGQAMPGPNIGEPLKAEITSRIVQSLALAPDLKPKADLLGKLVYSAVEPYVRGGAEEAGLSKLPLANSSPEIDLQSVRRDAIQDFAGWLVEGGRLSKLKCEQSLADLCDEWDDEANA
ncbi:TPA: hypothetical protein L6A81_35110 [Pseudomonas aeruginosa]|nr:hypothetical protein [Pseudomonas aeruginosa]